MSRTKGTIITGAPYEVNAAAPLDAKSNVGLKSDLFTATTWQAPSSSGANAGKMFCYYGMLVYVGNDTAENNGLYVLKNSGANDANVDALVETNWERISQPDSKIAAIKTNADKIDSKLDKDFVTQSSQGTLGEGTTFAARSDNTADATNVYITGKQIKDFAAAAVSDKGTFTDDTALKAAYPTPEDGWSATVLSTGTTWISADGQWTDSGKSNGVTSVNGKSGRVTLVAADIDDVLSDTETDQHIQAAFTADRIDLSTTAKTVVGGINEVKAATTKNAGDITANATAIAGKQDSTINLEIQGATAATVTDALTSLDTALTSAKSTADNAAKKDASNIEATTWKTVLGYQSADEVTTAVNNGITTNEYSTLATTAKTVKGAIEELKTAVDGKVATTDFNAVKADVDSLNTIVGDSTDGLVKDVNDNTAAINAANTEIAKKQNQAISIEGITAKNVEGALIELKNATTTNATAISGKADKSTTLAGYNIGDAYTKTETDSAIDAKIETANETLQAAIDAKVAKADIATSISAEAEASDTKVASEKAVATVVAGINTSIAGKADKADTLAGYGITDAYTKTETGEQITSAVSDAKSELQTAIDGKVAKTDITTTIAASAAASDTKVPSEKAVASAVEEVKSIASTAYKYKGSDTYENIVAKENPAVGDVWNSTTVNGVYPKGTNYAWNGTEWDALGGEVDLSAYQVKAITVGETSTTVETAINANKTAIDEHVAKQDNPHKVTAEQVGLGKVDNTADSEKPVSTAQQTALDLKQNKTDDTLATTDKTVVGAINEVKGVADAAAKADASNITVATWKTKLGFITAAEVPEQVQPDWNAISGKGQILNKPDVNTAGNITTIAGIKLQNKTLIAGNNTITITSEAAKIICKSAGSITEYVIDSGTAVKEIISGSDIFSITSIDDSGKIFTLAAIAAGVAEIIEL